MSKTIAELTEEVAHIYAEYEKQGTLRWTYKEAAADLPYQVGSLVKRVNQLQGIRHAEGLTREQLVLSIADEIADILSESLFIAQQLGIDIDQAFTAMLASDREKIAQRINTDGKANA